MSLLRAAPVSPSAAAMTRLRVRRDTLPRADGAAPAAADKREPVDTDTEDDDHDVGLDEGGLEGGARRRGRMGWVDAAVCEGAKETGFGAMSCELPPELYSSEMYDPEVGMTRE
ncbi:hypothetical protein ACCO45_012530 [Purpureocillium lilacinum]|uniref:Uncharacterized protein n=1 Tax=Purpureocillium lilacinum TaxID=33203 RepID=A0ACC4D8X1_PURLI